MASKGYQCKYLHGVIAPMTLNPMQPISYDKQIAVAIASCEQLFNVYGTQVNLTALVTVLCRNR